MSARKLLIMSLMNFHDTSCVADSHWGDTCENAAEEDANKILAMHAHELAEKMRNFCCHCEPCTCDECADEIDPEVDSERT